MCTLVQALRLSTGRTAHSGSTGIALLFLDHGIRRGWGVSLTPRPHSTPGKDPVPIVQEAGWAPGPVWTGAENLAHTGIWSPNRPARSRSLYRLRYQAHRENKYLKLKTLILCFDKIQVFEPTKRKFYKWTWFFLIYNFPQGHSCDYSLRAPAN